MLKFPDELLSVSAGKFFCQACTEKHQGEEACRWHQEKSHEGHSGLQRHSGGTRLRDILGRTIAAERIITIGYRPFSVRNAAMAICFAAGQNRQSICTKLFYK